MNTSSNDIFTRMLAGETISFHDPEYPKIMEKVSQTMQLSAKLNTATDIQQAREILSQIIGTNIDESTTVFVLFIPILVGLSSWEKCFYQPRLYVSGFGRYYYRR
jgi:hypothetical protein